MKPKPLLKIKLSSRRYMDVLDRSEAIYCTEELLITAATRGQTMLGYDRANDRLEFYGRMPGPALAKALADRGESIVRYLMNTTDDCL